MAIDYVELKRLADNYASAEADAAYARGVADARRVDFENCLADCRAEEKKEVESTGGEAKECATCRFFRDDGSEMRCLRVQRKIYKTWGVCKYYDRKVSEKPDGEALRKLAAGLREHNAWRRSEGKYASEVNEKGEIVGIGAQNPHTPAELGALIEAAAAALEEAAK